MDGQGHPESTQGLHDEVRVTMEKDRIPFDRNQHQFAQSIWAGTRNVQIEPPAMNCPFGTSPTPLTALGAIKVNLSTEMAKSCAETSSASPTSAPAANQLQECQQSKALTPYNANAWK
ncbi:hypothetical protein V8B97DRAFT_1917887 [Scleroderma yunnanense]